MSQPAETIWKKKLQRFGLLRWVFQKCYSLVSYKFSSPFYIFITRWRSQFLLMVARPQDSTNLFAFAKLVSFMSYSVSIWFFFFSKNPASQNLSLELKMFSNLHVYPLPVSVKPKAWKVKQTLRGSSPNFFWHSFLRITGVELARMAENLSFSFFRGNFSYEKATVTKSIFNPDEWMVANFWGLRV